MAPADKLKNELTWRIRIHAAFLELTKAESASLDLMTKLATGEKVSLTDITEARKHITQCLAKVEEALELTAEAVKGASDA